MSDTYFVERLTRLSKGEKFEVVYGSDDAGRALHSEDVQRFCFAPWNDKDDGYTPAIEAAHPINSGDPYNGLSRWKVYEAALEMVGNRRGKYELVNLVNWLLLRAKLAEFALWGLGDAIDKGIKKQPGPHTFRTSDGEVHGGIIGEDVNRILTTLTQAAEDGRRLEHAL